MQGQTEAGGGGRGKAAEGSREGAGRVATKEERCWLMTE